MSESEKGSTEESGKSEDAMDRGPPRAEPEEEAPAMR